MAGSCERGSEPLGSLEGWLAERRSILVHGVNLVSSLTIKEFLLDVTTGIFRIAMLYILCL